MQKLKLTYAVEYEYEPISEHYGTTDILDMAAIDKKNWQEYPEEMLEYALRNGAKITITVEPS